MDSKTCIENFNLFELEVTNNRLYICTLSDLDPDHDLEYIKLPNGSYYFKDMGVQEGYMWCKPGEEKTKGDDNMIITTRAYHDAYLQGTYHHGKTRNSDLIKIRDVLLKTKSRIRIVDEEDDEYEIELDNHGNEYIPDYNNYPLMFYLTERIDIEDCFAMYFKEKTIINDKIIYKIVFNDRFVGYVVNTELINIYGDQAGIWITLKNNDKKKLEVVNFGNCVPNEDDFDEAIRNYLPKITSYDPNDPGSGSDSCSDSDE